MNARGVKTYAGGTQRGLRGARWESPGGTVIRYRLDVVASDVADVVFSVGGWLFDRVMAGWDVNVLVADPCDVRPLQILGVRALSFDSEFESIETGQLPRPLAVATDVLASDARVRETVVMAVERGLGEVTLWGNTSPTAFGHGVDSVQHRLSAAALAFKSHALQAAAIMGASLNPFETFLAPHPKGVDR